MIAQTLQAKIGEAMKARDEIRLSTLRLLSSAFNYEKIEKQHELDDSEELVVIRRQTKQRKDSIEAYKKAGDRDRELREAEELKILQEFLPPEIEESELIRLVDLAIGETGAKTTQDMGKVIGLVKSKSPGADGSKIAEIIKTKLNG